jgi:hypothetical protein
MKALHKLNLFKVHVEEKKKEKKKKRQIPWPESASKLYQPRDRRLSAKLVPNFADRGVVSSAELTGGRLL